MMEHSCSRQAASANGGTCHFACGSIYRDLNFKDFLALQYGWNENNHMDSYHTENVNVHIHLWVVKPEQRVLLQYLCHAGKDNGRAADGDDL